MDRYLFPATGILVYVAMVIFISGTVYRVIKWQHGSKQANPQDAPGKPKGSRWMSLLIIALHIAGIGLIMGHTRLFGDIGFVVSIIGEDRLNQVGNILGTGLGLFVIIALGYLFVRRLKSPHKEFSTPADYAFLLFTIFLVLLGNYLRLAKPFGLEDYQAYTAALVALSPVMPESIATSSAKLVLSGHVFTVSLLLCYFPFSNLIPTICQLISRQRKCGQSGTSAT